MAAARRPPGPERGLPAIVTAGFFLTGFTALAAEVVLNRLLRYVFGSGHAATATVLAAYMAGLSAGAWLFGRLSARLHRKLAAYGFLELAVALFYVATPALYGLFKEVGVEAGRALADSPAALLAARFSLSFAFVFLPTLFMGGTLPVLLGALREGDTLGVELPRLYAANTLGAAAGTLASAYLLMPSLGLDGSLSLCAIFNAGVALVALSLSSRLEAGAGALAAAAQPAPAGAQSTIAPEQEPLGAPNPPEAPGAEATSTPSLPQAALLPLAFAQGTMVFALEVVWTHLVGTVIGVTVYAFATMLAAILFGIGLGAAILPRLQRRLGWSHAALFVALEAAAGAAVAATLPLWDRFPDLIGLLTRWKPAWSFGERELARFLFATSVMLPVTVLTGAALPALAAATGARVEHAGRLVGRVFAANTLGAILGSLLTGFVLLGRVPSQALLAGCALGALLVALVGLLALRGPRVRAARALAGAAALLLLALAAAPAWDPVRLTAGAHYYWAPVLERPLETLFFREDAQVGFVSVERQASGELVMKTNGKYESSDAALEFQDFLGPLGASYLERFENAFLLGLGPGRTLALLHEMPFRRIDVAEFSPAVVAGARAHFASFVEEPLADPRVRLHVDDGRNVLQLSPVRYDLVVAAITGAAFAGTGSLYNRDFFALVRRQLAPGGVLLLWLQLHHVPEAAVRSVFYTLRSVFPQLHVYMAPGGSQSYLIASGEPLRVRRAALATLERGARARRMLDASKLYSAEALAAWSVLVSDEEIAAFLRDGPHRLYTDFDPAFEYVAPYGLALPIVGHRLEHWSARRLPEFDPPLAPGEAAGLLGVRLKLNRDDQAALAALLEAERLLGPSRFSPHLRSLERALDSGAPAPPPVPPPAPARP